MAACSFSMNSIDLCNRVVSCLAIRAAPGALATHQLSQMILSLFDPVILGLDRPFWKRRRRHVRMTPFRYLTGLPQYPRPESLRRFLLQAEPDFREQLHWVNFITGSRRFIHRPRSI